MREPALGDGEIEDDCQGDVDGGEGEADGGVENEADDNGGGGNWDRCSK
jgi:hypothetical protein